MRWIVLGLMMAACGRGGGEQPPSAAPSPWREDLAALASEVSTHHKNPFFHVAEPAWRAEVAKLDAAIPTLDDAHVQVGLVRIVAMLGDAHTRLFLARERVFPIAFLVFEDGVFVGGADANGQWAIGKKVVAVGGTPIDAAIAKLTPLVATENDANVLAALPALLADPVALAGSDLATGDLATFTIEGGRALEVTAAARGVPLAPPKTMPLHLQGPTQLNYWNQYVEADHLLYFQYNVCADDPRIKPLAQFAVGMFGFVDLHQIDRFVIDLRSNTGGNSEVIEPVLAGIAARPALAGRVFVLIGRATFSSGMLAATAAKWRLNATLVGTPTGGNPNGYGEIKIFKLPHSHLVAQYSTKLFANTAYRGTSVTPDLPVHVTSADWFGGNDPAMAAVLAAPIPPR